jgi:hypothetical protein
VGWIATTPEFLATGGEAWQHPEADRETVIESVRRLVGYVSTPQRGLTMPPRYTIDDSELVQPRR